MIGEELVPGLPETRRPEERPLSNAEAVAAGLVVSAVRALAVRRYERAERPAPTVMTRARGGTCRRARPGRGAGGGLAALYSGGSGTRAASEGS
jgi:hypothetical protein